MIAKRIHIAGLLILFSSFLTAQTVQDRTMDKAENKANNRVDSKVDQGLDKGLDAIEGLFKKKKKKQKEAASTSSGAAKELPEEEHEVEEETAPASSKRNAEIERDQEAKKKAQTDAYSGMFGNMFQAAEWENSYTFDLVSEATMTTTDKKGKQEVSHVNMYASEDAFGMRMDEEKKGAAKGFVVFDFENQSFITLTEKDGKKEGMAIAMTEDQKSIMSSEDVKEVIEDEYNKVRFRKTGRSKMIAGYLALEYEAEGEGGEGTMWTTQDVNFDDSRFYSLFGDSKERRDFMPESYPEGHLLEMDFTDAETRDRNQYLVTRLDDNAKEVIDLSPYNVMDMKTMMEQGGKR